MESRAVQFHPEAGAEAFSAACWYRDRNVAAADAFLRELDRAVQRISESPGRWPESILGTRRFLLRHFPFSIVYRETNDGIELLPWGIPDESLAIGDIALRSE